MSNREDKFCFLLKHEQLLIFVAVSLRIGGVFHSGGRELLKRNECEAYLYVNYFIYVIIHNKYLKWNISKTSCKPMKLFFVSD